MADIERSFKNHNTAAIVEDAGEYEKNSLQSPPPPPPEKKQKLDEKSVGTEDDDEDDDVFMSDEDSDGSDYLCQLNTSPTVGVPSLSLNDFLRSLAVTDEQFALLKSDYCPDGVEEIDEDVWSKYFQEIKDSEGFDIDHFPGHCPMVQFTPMHLGNCKNLKDLTDLSNAAIDVFNDREGAKYELEKVEKGNSELWDAGINYYITFRAKDSVANALNTFQALVWWGSELVYSEPIIVKFCRLKAVVA